MDRYAERRHAQIDKVLGIEGEIGYRNAMQDRFAYALGNFLVLHPAMRAKSDHRGDFAVGNSGCIQLIEKNRQDELLRRAARTVIHQEQRLCAMACNQLGQCG